MTVKFTSPVALLVVMSVVAGCHARSSEPADPGPTVVTSATESAEGLPGSTPAGTRLRFGEQAVIPVGVGDKRARVGVIVTGVERGAPEDSAALATMAADRSATDPVYFIRAVLINEDGMKGGGSFSGPVLYGDLAGGGDAGGFQSIGGTVTLPHCVSVSRQPPEWVVVGARHEICRIVYARPEAVRLPVGTGSIRWS